MKSFKTITTIAILFVLANTIWAQYEYNLIQYTIDDGLPSDLVYDMIQDQKGYLWFATDKGLAKFDGYSFKLFTTADGLPNNDVWDLFEDSQGRIFVMSFYNGIVYIKDEKVHRITDNRVETWSFSSSFADFRGKIWIPTTNQLLSLTNDKVNIEDRFKERPFFEPNRFFYKDTLSRFFLLEELTGITVTRPYFRIIEEGKPAYKLPLKGGEAIYLPKNRTLAITNDRFHYWTKNGIYQYDFYTKKTKFIAFNKLNANANSFIDYYGDYVWRIDNQVFTFTEDFTMNEVERFILPDNIVTKGRIFRDIEKNWWINTRDEGVVCITYQSQQTKHFRPPSTNVKYIQIDQQNNIFLGAQYASYPQPLHHLYWLSENDVLKLVEIDKNEPTSIGSVILNDNKLLISRNWSDRNIHFDWLETADILQSKPSQIKEYSIPRKLLGSKSTWDKKKIALGSQSNIRLVGGERAGSIKDASYSSFSKNYWLSNNGGVFLIKKNETNTGYTYWFELVESKRTYSLAHQGVTMWMARTTGLYWWDESKLHFSGEQQNEAIKHPTFDYKINDLAVDSVGNMWIGTDGFGVYRCRDCKNEITEIVEGTESDIVQQLFVKDENEVWIATANGLKRITVTSHHPFETETTTFNTTYGLPNRVINTVFVKDSIAYIGTREGLTLLPTNLQQTGLQKPILHISNIAINQKDTTISNSYQLSYNQNNLRISYVALSYKSQKRVTYRYRMQGIDADWKTTTLLERDYPQLNAGTYTFDIQAIDLNGVASDIQSIQFTILKPWWQQAWFFILLTFLTSGLIYGYFTWRLKQVAKAEKEQRAIEKRFADLELQALQAQMNPHFIFNSLSAIQDFILDNNVEAADQYLVKFARLMRSYLDASKEKFTTVDDELKLLRLYVELEQLRFKNKFEVRWMVDDEVDIYAELPSMLIQPFVENAINHGLNFKEEDGGLLEIIVVEVDEDTIRCTVKDNGIGRVAAKAIQARTEKYHKSRGMQIIEERLSTLELMQETNIDIQVKDLYDGSQAMGTQVDILIKLAA